MILCGVALSASYGKNPAERDMGADNSADKGIDIVRYNIYDKGQSRFGGPIRTYDRL